MRGVLVKDPVDGWPMALTQEAWVNDPERLGYPDANNHGVVIDYRNRLTRAKTNTQGFLRD